MSSSSEDTRVTMLYATRAMSEEAMRLAGQAAAGSPEHDFFAGVASPADAYRQPARAPHDDPRWFERYTPAFRDGYLKASAVIAAAASHPRLHLLMPTLEVGVPSSARP
jgi:hypothetical protein